MKKMKKALAILLTLSLVVTMAVPSFAADPETSTAAPITKTYGGTSENTINYLAIGDSQTNGYWLDGYFVKENSVKNNNIKFTDTHGFNRYVENTYPDRFSKYLNENGYNVNLYQYGISALRCEDLHWLLNKEDKENDADYFWYDWFESKEDSEGHASAGHYLDTMYLKSENGTETQEDLGYDKANQYYNEAVEKADIISLALGTNTFGQYMPKRMLSWVENLNSDDPEVNPYDIGDYLTGTQKKVFDSFVSTMKSLAGKLGASDEYQTLIQYIIHDMSYSLVSFMTGYEWCLEDIEKLNSDATVITMGMTNVCQDIVLKINVNNFSIPLSLDLFYETTMKAMNTYMKLANAKSNLNTIYVEPGEFEMQIETIKNLEKDKVDFDEEIEDLMLLNVKSIIGKYFGFLGDDYTDKKNIMQGVKLVLDSPCDGSSNVGSGIEDDADLRKIGQVYLGIRDVLIDVADEPEVDLIEGFSCYGNEDAVKDILLQGNETKTDETAKSALTNENDIRKKVSDILSTNGLKDIMYVYDRMLENAAGSHASINGHETFYDNMVAAYEKSEKAAKTKEVLKKAVPVVVGGVAVALITSSVVKKLKANSDATVSGADTSLTDETEGTEVAATSTFKEKLSQAITTLKEKFAELIEKIKAGNTYEFIYQKNE